MAAGQCVEPAGGRWYDFCRQPEKEKTSDLHNFFARVHTVGNRRNIQMPKEVLYLKLEQNAELSGESVHISDLGKIIL